MLVKETSLIGEIMSVQAERITRDTVIEHVIRQFPKTLDILVRYNIDCCCGAYQTIEQGATSRGADVELLLKDLNEAIA